MRFSSRLAFTVILLVGTGLFLRVHSKAAATPSHQPFATFPHRVGVWTGQDEAIPADVREELGPGDFFSRKYQSGTITQPVDVFVAYFPSQRMGNGWHSPENCLPGAGWTPLASERMQIVLPTREAFFVNRYLVVKNGQRGLVFYWYRAHNRVTTSEYLAKLYLVTDSLRFGQSDGALIRFATEVDRHETEAAAEKRLISCLSDLAPILVPYGLI